MGARALHLQAQDADLERDRLIKLAHSEGTSVPAIMDATALSRPRVYQILEPGCYRCQECSWRSSSGPGEEDVLSQIYQHVSTTGHRENPGSNRTQTNERNAE